MGTPVYLDPTRSVADRVEAVLALMSTEQRLNCFDGIPETVLADGFTLPEHRNTFDEVLHGSGHHPDATMFPQAIGLGQTWNTALLERIGERVSTEMRHRDRQALAAFGPVADLRANPLAGRFEEGYGEDPLHVAAMVTAYAHGLRGREREYVRVLPQMKHLLGYGHEWQRHRTSASMGVRALHEYQAVPYRKPVQAGAVLGAMTAYNLVNGVPSIISPLLAEVRREWAPGPFMFLPDGWDAVNLNTTKGAPFDTWEVPEGRDVPYPAALIAEDGGRVDRDELFVHACALMLAAGHTHLRDGSDLPFNTGAAEAIRRGLYGLTMADADRVVRDWLTFMIAAGRLDGDACAYNRIERRDAAHTDPDARALALRAAREQLVLLKHDRALLPLTGSPRVAVVGPLAAVNLRDYYSPLTTERVSVLQALRERLGAANTPHHSGNDVVAWSVEGRRVGVAADGRLVTGAGPATFEVVDWAHDQYFFKHVESGRYLSADLLAADRDGGAEADQDAAAPSFTNQVGASGGRGGPVLAATDESMVDANAWFTFQNFHYRRQDGTARIFGLNHVQADLSASDVHGVRVGEDGSLPLVKGDEGIALAETVLSQGPAAAAALAADADCAVVVVGNHPLVNARECFDRPGLDLAPRQAALARAVAAARPGRTVVVVVSAYPLAIGDLEADANIAAIVYSSHAGQAAGTAIADALFGDCAPAGRLTSTWLADTASLPTPGPVTEPFRVDAVDMLEYDVIAAELTYRYSRAAPLYPFGHGLSYTEFAYGALEAPPRVTADTPFDVAFDLSNTGERASDEVAIVYARSLDSAYGDRVPARQVAGFTRVADVAPGSTRRVTVAIDPADLFVWDVVTDARVVETGRYALRVGDGPETIVHLDGHTIAPLDLSAGRNVWEAATIAGGVTYWEVAKRRTAERAGGHHSTGSRRAGDHVGFTNVVLDGAVAVELRCATTGADWADLDDPVVEVRTGAPDGPVLGRVRVPPTGDLQTFTDVAAPLTGAAGTADVYLRFGCGGIYVDSIRLRR